MDLFFQLYKNHSGVRCYFLHLLLASVVIEITKNVTILVPKNNMVLLKILAASQ